MARLPSAAMPPKSLLGCKIVADEMFDGNHKRVVVAKAKAMLWFVSPEDTDYPYVAGAVREALEHEFGGLWNVAVGDHTLIAAITYQPGAFLIFKVKKHTVVAFHTYDRFAHVPDGPQPRGTPRTPRAQGGPTTGLAVWGRGRAVSRARGRGKGRGTGRGGYGGWVCTPLQYPPSKR